MQRALHLCTVHLCTCALAPGTPLHNYQALVQPPPKGLLSALIAKYNDFPRMPSKEDNFYFITTGSQRARKSKTLGLSKFLLSYAADKDIPSSLRGPLSKDYVPES